MAQPTLGRIQDAGARKLEAGEAHTLLVGHTFIRRNGQGNSINISLLPDGTLTGRSASTLGATGVVGTWNLADDGRMCATYRFTDGRIRPIDWCGYHYAVGHKYYVVPGEQVSSAPIRRVWIAGKDDKEEAASME